MAKNKIKSKHALNWFYGNICTKKCYEDCDKQRKCHEKMGKIISGHEDYLITHKMFIWVMRQKHKVCDLSDRQFYRRETDFWTKKSHTCRICSSISSVSRQEPISQNRIHF